MNDNTQHHLAVTTRDSDKKGWLSFEGVSTRMLVTGNRWLWLLAFSIQDRRFLDFGKTWSSYKQGEYISDKNLWLGNHYLHLLTSNQATVIDSSTRGLLPSWSQPLDAHKDALWRLRVEVQDTDGKWFSAEYECFYVGNEAEDYALEVSGYLEEASDMGDGFELLPRTTQCSRCGPECHKSTFVTYDHPAGNSKFRGWWYSSETHPLSDPETNRFMGAVTAMNGWWPAKDSSRINPINSRLYTAGYSYFK